jgi:RNA polymerase sigma-70 factor (ECF subfamily)
MQASTQASAAAAGDRLDVDVLSIHAEHADFVWLTLQRLGVAPADIEDCLQDVFVVVHQRLGSFDGSSRMTTWLYGICIRVAAAYRRRAHRRREQTGEEMDETVDEGESPEAAASRREAREHLQRVLDEMDIEKRALFVMFEIDEVSCEEIAEILGIPVGTVYSRLHAARKEFEAALRRVEARDRPRPFWRRGGRS